MVKFIKESELTPLVLTEILKFSLSKLWKENVNLLPLGEILKIWGMFCLAGFDDLKQYFAAFAALSSFVSDFLSATARALPIWLSRLAISFFSAVELSLFGFPSAENFTAACW